MKINISNAAEILSMTEDELLMESQQVDDLNAIFVPPTDMVYNEDGTVRFIDEGDTESSWEFEMDDVLKYKKVLDEKRLMERNRKIKMAVQTANQELIGE